MRSIVGLVGAPHSGRRSAAATLVSSCGFQQLALADGPKEVCRLLFLLSQEQLQGEGLAQVDARWGATPQQLWHRVHHELGLDEALWHQRFRLLVPSSSHLVIPDVNSDADVQLLRSLPETHVHFVHVQRGGGTTPPWLPEGRDCWVNDGTLADLRPLVLRWAERTLALPSVVRTKFVMDPALDAWLMTRTKRARVSLPILP